MSFKYCPGIKTLTGPVQIIIRSCPSCGEEIEFFSDEVEAKCPECGHKIHREATPSCVTWCKYAIKCIDDLEKRELILTSRVEELKKLAKKNK